ncbi:MULTISPECIES: very short patch repair endonuclease [unclassified Maridesulfovibrio]|uniref:very short patch repair endonuclease n=1 Tax=unclassified Maridesulfovibrio TaxID=2794999 RepID=UPI003B3FC141
MDKLTPKKRSWNMSRIKSKNTKPERIVRSLLHNMGFRFRLHRKDLPGKPDIVLPKYKTIIFVHGCFWHQHPGCKDSKIPKSNSEYWINKFNNNAERDKIAVEKLEGAGWHVITVWACETKDLDRLAGSLFEEIMDM